MTASPALERWINAGSISTLLGHRIFTRTALAPNKEPLLLIHGYPTASYDWHKVWPGLAERYSLVTLDMLGFGMSAKPPNARYPIGLQADLCEALLQQHGIVQPHVLAHDYGDTVAQELLAREREGRLRLASVCFLNGGLFPETHRARPIQKLLANPLLGPLLAARHGLFELREKHVGHLRSEPALACRVAGLVEPGRARRRSSCPVPPDRLYGATAVASRALGGGARALARAAAAAVWCSGSGLGSTPGGAVSQAGARCRRRGVRTVGALPATRGRHRGARGVRRVPLPGALGSSQELSARTAVTYSAACSSSPSPLSSGASTYQPDPSPASFTKRLMRIVYAHYARPRIGVGSLECPPARKPST